MVMDVIWRRLSVSMLLGRVIIFVLSWARVRHSREVGTYLFKAANVWWRCAQYLVIASCG